MTEKEIRAFIAKASDLSTTPMLLDKILSLVADDSKSTEDLSLLISHDQAMAQRVLRMANSAFFAHAGQIKDIHQAVMFLGLDRIKSIAVGMSVMNIFPATGSFHVENLWLHSYEVAFLSSMLSESIGITQPQESFLAGLLHDIGRIVLYSADHEAFLRIETTDTMLDQETNAFGCTHAAAGAWLAEEIGLPYSIVTAIKYHHKPSGAPDEMNLVSLLSLAEALTRMFRPRVEDDGIWTREHDAILLELSLSPDYLLTIKNRFLESENEIEQFFSSDQQDGEDAPHAKTDK
jgi:putative nucleotidyltransferase with HDIG domain